MRSKKSGPENAAKPAGLPETADESASSAAATNLTRRKLLTRLGIGATLLALGGQAYAFIRSLVPNVLYEDAQRFKVGTVDQFGEGAKFIEDKRVVSPANAVVNLNLQEQTRKVLSTLTPREEKVLRMRFGIGEKSDHTLEEVGQNFDVTRERIRQIEAKALRKLRHPSRSKRLRGFVEK